MTVDILTGLLVLITGFYAWVTFRILRANERVVEVMKQQSESLIRPYITVTPFIERNSPVFVLRVKNTGKMPALKLRLKLDKDFYSFGDKNRNIADFPAFLNTIDSFAPSEELLFSLDMGTSLFQEEKSINPKQFIITTAYSFGETQVEETHAVDLRSYWRANIPSDSHEKRLGDIQKEISKLVHVIKEVKGK